MQRTASGLSSQLQAVVKKLSHGLGARPGYPGRMRVIVCTLACITFAFTLMKLSPTFWTVHRAAPQQQRRSAPATRPPDAILANATGGSEPADSTGQRTGAVRADDKELASANPASPHGLQVKPTIPDDVLLKLSELEAQPLPQPLTQGVATGAEGVDAATGVTVTEATSTEASHVIDADAAARDAAVCSAVASGDRMQNLRVRAEQNDEAMAAAVEASGSILSEGRYNQDGSYKFPFRVPENPGSMMYADVDWCPGSHEPPPEEVPPVDPRFRALFVVGAQKAGTTWLHYAFKTHPGMVQGLTRIESRQKGGNYKELQFFNAWPARNTSEFLSMWPKWQLKAMTEEGSQNFLFDATPEYLLNAAVPPRIKQMVPQAKIVIVLRDPTDRAFSSWSMNADRNRFCDSARLPLSRLCVERSFRSTLSAWHNSFERHECKFRTPGADVSWGECFKCRYNLFRYSECCALREQHTEDLFPCFGVQRGFNVFDYSSYAAQIAWWLEFFPPEQIYIVADSVLKDKKKRIQVLHELLEFVGVPNAPRFDTRKVNSASAFIGKYKEATPEDEADKKLVRLYQEPHVQDLRALMDRFFPNVDLSSFA